MHNYRLKLEWLLARNKLSIRPGQMHHVHVAHDDWCAVYRGGDCATVTPKFGTAKNC